MISLFKNTQPSAILAVILLAVGLRIFCFWQAVEIPLESLSPLSNMLFSFIMENMPDHRMIAALSIILILLQAIYFNAVINKHQLLYKNSYIPAAMFVVICSLDTQLATIFPQLIANIFLLLFMSRIFRLQDAQNSLMLLFDAGMMIALASLFTFESILVFPFLLYTVALIRPFHWREYAVCFLGLFIPYYFTAIAFYLADLQPLFFSYYKNDLFNLHLNRIYLGTAVLVPLCVIAVVLAIAFVKLLANYYKNMIKIRMYQQLLLFYLILTILLFFLHGIPTFRSIVFASAPLSFFTAYYFLGDNRIWLKNLLFLTLLGTIIYFQVTAG